MRKCALIVAVALLVWATGGCKKKTATTLPSPPPAQAPPAPVEVRPPAQPKAETSMPAEAKPPVEERPSAVSPPTTSRPTRPPAAATRRPRRPSSKKGTTIAQNQPGGEHVPPPPPPPQLAATLSPQQEELYRSRAQATIAETERHLATLKARRLSSPQRATVKQVQTFLTQARQALAAGDPVRASTLAHKAHLLSVELLQSTE